MSEDVSLLNTLNNKRSLFSSIIDPQNIVDGSENKKYLQLEKRGHEISLVKREISTEEMLPIMKGFNEGELGDTLAEKYAFAVRLMKKRGMPVVDTVRVISDNEVAVTNVVANGGWVFDLKTERLKLYLPNTYGERTRKYDDTIFKINEEELKQKINLIGENATANGIQITDDSPFHIVINHDDQNYSVNCLDIAFTTIWKDVSDAKLDPKFVDSGWTLKSANDRTCSDFISLFGGYKRSIVNNMSKI